MARITTSKFNELTKLLCKIQSDYGFTDIQMAIFLDCGCSRQVIQKIRTGEIPLTPRSKIFWCAFEKLPEFRKKAQKFLPEAAYPETNRVNIITKSIKVFRNWFKK